MIGPCRPDAGTSMSFWIPAWEAWQEASEISGDETVRLVAVGYRMV